MRSRLAVTLAVSSGLAAAAGSVACENHSYREIGAEIGVITKRSDALVNPAIDRLRNYGRQAIPQIEIALHTASEGGRGRLVSALRAIGDGEAIPILRHFAVYDVSAAVRGACEGVLTEWATAGDDRARSARATEALAQVKAWRTQGEGPAAARPSAAAKAAE